MEKDSKIMVFGHRGMVGSAIVRALKSQDYEKVYDAGHIDLCDQASVDSWFESTKPEYVFLAAAKVGGIMANYTYPAQFIYDNLMIQTNVIHACSGHGVKKLMFLGSSCIYPRDCSQPIKEEYLMTGKLEATNDAYAVAKISGIKMCQAYAKQYGFDSVCAMPTNLLGENDNFDLESSHVLPAMIRKFHEAKENYQPVTLWGTGSPRREFLYVDDLAEALIFLMENAGKAGIFNIGTGQDISLREVAELVAEIVGYTGPVFWEVEKPDGTPRKVLDVSKINALGWKASTSLRTAIEKTYAWYKEQVLHLPVAP